MIEKEVPYHIQEIYSQYLHTDFTAGNAEYIGMNK